MMPPDKTILRLALILAPALLPAQQAEKAEAPGDRLSKPCETCSGKGKVPCPVCKGARGKNEPCSLCRGAGTVPCTAASCQEKPSRKCTVCSGKGTIRCKKCKGEKKTWTDCYRCSLESKDEPTGTLACRDCGGTGRIQIERSAPAKPSSTKLKELKADLEHSRKSLQDSVATLESMKSDLEELKDLGSRLESGIQGTGDLSKNSPGLRKFRQKVEEDLKDVLEEISQKVEEAGEAPELPKVNVGEVREHLRRIEDALGRLPGVGLSDLAALAREVEAEDAYATKLAEKISVVERRQKDLRAALERFHSEVKEIDARRVEETSEKKAREETRKNIEDAFFRFQMAFERPSAAADLPDLRSRIDWDFTHDPRNLCIEIAYLDGEAKDNPDPEMIKPTDKHLEKLPALLDDAFKASPDVKRIIAAVQVLRTGKVAAGTPRTFQRFMVDSKKWLEIRGSDLRSDWVKTLAACDPDPTFPRVGLEEPPMTAIGIFSVVILVAVGLFLAVILFVGIRLIK